MTFISSQSSSFFVTFATMMQEDIQFMSRALQIAEFGKGRVSPNPMVGCVIVHNSKIVGEGWHKKAGEPHAEVLAIDSVKNKDVLREATVYVTLEPCSHFGKTPPCADLLINNNVKKVIVGCTDPNPLVAGKGIAKLKEAGIEVVEDVLKSECLALNKSFFLAMTLGRPYIIIKWAQTSDGFIARKNFDSKWISGTLSRQLVHKTRSEVDAILVGKNTVKYDNPALTTRDWAGKSPVRLIVDHLCSTTEDFKVMDGSVMTYIFNLEKSHKIENLHYVKLSEDTFWEELMMFLHTQNLQTVLVEGGTQTIQQLIGLNLWDEAAIFTSPHLFHIGILSPQLNHAVLVKTSHIESDQLQNWIKPSNTL